MFSRYVYSINGEDYLGAYETRAAAEAAALKAALRMTDPPASVFVARSTLPNPRASGLGRLVLSHMIAREEAGGDGYLNNVSEAEAQNLDGIVEAAVLGWLARHDRAPSVYRIEGISELQVPGGPERLPIMHDDAEVCDLGVGSGVEALI